MKRFLAGLCALGLLIAYWVLDGEPEGPSGTDFAPVPSGAEATGSPSATLLAPDGATPLDAVPRPIAAADCGVSGIVDGYLAQEYGPEAGAGSLRWDLSKKLAPSPMAEHLHAAALLNDDPVSRLVLFERAIALGGAQPFLLYDAVQYCSERCRGGLQCPLRAWEAMLIAADGENSEVWMRVAANRYRAGEPAAALQALLRAASAGESREYFADRVELFERSLVASSDFAFPVRALLAFAFAASVLPNYQDYTDMCKEQSARSVDWGQACVAYGELVERRGRTEIGVGIARAIQRVSLEAMGEMYRAAEVETRTKVERRRLQAARDAPNFDRLVLTQPELFFTYLHRLKVEGETTARRKTKREVRRLLARRPDLVCGD